MTLFTYVPSYGATNDKQPKIKKSVFGDGYAQRQPDGINNIKQVWNLTFGDREKTEIDAIEAFLESLNGTEYFTWVPPRQAVAKKFICEKWSRSINKGNIDSISATFEQVFDA